MAKKRSYPNVQWRDGVAQLEVTVNGKRVRESLHTSNFNLAVERRDKRIAELKEGYIMESRHWRTPGEAPVRYKTVREWADIDIARQRANGSSEHVVKNGLMIQWKRICQRFETVEDITDSSVAKYYADHRVAGLAHVSIKRDIPLLYRCLRWGRTYHADLGMLTWAVPRQSTRVKNQRGVNAGTAHDPQLLRDWLRALTRPARAQAAIVLCTGLRAFEVKRVTAKMLKPSGLHSAILDLPTNVTKGGIPRRVGVTENVAKVLRYAIEHGELQHDYKKQMRSVGTRIVGDSVTLRDLRHTYASLASPVDADATRLAMGHKTGERSSAMFYQHADDARLLRIARAVSDEFGDELAMLVVTGK